VKRGGHLATIDSASKQDAIYKVVQAYQGSNVWIGLHDRTTEETFEWTSGVSGYVCITTAPFDFLCTCIAFEYILSIVVD